MIGLNDFQRQWRETREAVLGAVESVGASGSYILGDEVSAFEASLASIWGVKYCVGVGSGLDALEIALRLAGCVPGTRVVTSPLTAFATTLAILKLGAVPVFVDIDESGLIDLGQAEEALKRFDIRLMVPVHLYGHTLDLNRLRYLRDTYGCTIVEDCAQAIMSRFDGESTASAGQCAAVSFYPTKNLGAMGDGGALLTNIEDCYVKARRLRDYGQSGKYVHQHVGYNSRLDELSAALLRRAYLPKLTQWTARRKEIAARYRVGITNPAIGIPCIPVGSDSVWHLFPVLVDPPRKASFLQQLASQSIAAGEHYPTLAFQQPALLDVEHYVFGDCPVAKTFATSEVSLPIHPHLTDGEVDRVIQACNEWRVQCSR